IRQRRRTRRRTLFRLGIQRLGTRHGTLFQRGNCLISAESSSSANAREGVSAQVFIVDSNKKPIELFFVRSRHLSHTARPLPLGPPTFSPPNSNPAVKGSSQKSHIGHSSLTDSLRMRRICMLHLLSCEGICRSFLSFHPRVEVR